jgi:hypothetical protein
MRQVVEFREHLEVVPPEKVHGAVGEAGAMSRTIPIRAHRLVVVAAIQVVAVEVAAVKLVQADGEEVTAGPALSVLLIRQLLHCEPPFRVPLERTHTEIRIPPVTAT